MFFIFIIAISSFSLLDSYSGDTPQDKSLPQSKSILDSDIIAFSSLPPSPLCTNYNEVIEEVILKLGTVDLRWGILDPDYYGCITNGKKDISIEYCLMEDDPLSDDEIKCITGTATTYDCETLNLENLRGDLAKRKFTNLALRTQFDEFIESWDGKIEIYATVSSPDEYFSEYSSAVFDINGEDCDCLTGSCCNLAERPFLYKSEESQPTGKTDSYYCTGTNSPTETSYVKLKDYYCTGSNANENYTISIADTCGTCELCIEGSSACMGYNLEQSCGMMDCDDLDTSCKNYNDVEGKCVLGVCKSSCIDYTNKAKGISCGTGKKCDGNGNCVACSSHDYSECYTEDSYWYDSCGVKEEKKAECGTSSCTSWLSNYCTENDAYRKRTCYDKGCSAGVCFNNTNIDEEIVQDCSYGCESGKCKSAPTTCSRKSDCGADGYAGNTFCDGNYVKQNYVTYTCNNPGTSQSFCSHTDTAKEIEGCLYGCLNGACKNSSQNTSVIPCSADSDCAGKIMCPSVIGQDTPKCNSTSKICYCGKGGINCSFDSNCGINKYTGNSVCSNGNVKQNYTNYTCSNAGTAQSSCSSSSGLLVKESCSFGCENAKCKKPDLTVTDLIIQGIKDKKVTLGFTIKNIGNAIANSVYWMIDTNSADADPKRTNAVTLSPGEKTRAYMSWEYANSGDYNPIAIIDFDNLVNESDEENNMMSVPVWLFTSNNVDAIISQCKSACNNGNAYGYCEMKRTLKAPDMQNVVLGSCSFFATTTDFKKYGIAECLGLCPNT